MSMSDETKARIQYGILGIAGITAIAFNGLIGMGLIELVLLGLHNMGWVAHSAPPTWVYTLAAVLAGVSLVGILFFLTLLAVHRAIIHGR